MDVGRWTIDRVLVSSSGKYGCTSISSRQAIEHDCRLTFAKLLDA